MSVDALLALDEPPFSFPANLTELASAFAIAASHALAQPKGSDKWGLVDAGGALVGPPAFDGGRVSTTGRYCVKLGAKLGFCDETAQVVIPARYDGADVFSEGLCPVWIQQKPKKLGYKVGFIDEAGEMVIEPRFGSALPFRDGLAPVQIDKLWGFIDRTGAVVIEPVFARAWCFHAGVAQVVSSGTVPASAKLRTYAKSALTEMRGKWGTIDRDGSFVISPTFDYSESQFGGMETVQSQHVSTGRHLETAMWRIWGAARFSAGAAAVRVGGKKWGICDERGELVVPAEWDVIRPLVNGATTLMRLVDVASRTWEKVEWSRYCV